MQYFVGYGVAVSYVIVKLFCRVNVGMFTTIHPLEFVVIYGKAARRPRDWTSERKRRWAMTTAYCTCDCDIKCYINWLILRANFLHKDITREHASHCYVLLAIIQQSPRLPHWHALPLATKPFVQKRTSTNLSEALMCQLCCSAGPPACVDLTEPMSILNWEYNQRK